MCIVVERWERGEETNLGFTAAENLEALNGFYKALGLCSVGFCYPFWFYGLFGLGSRRP